MEDTVRISILILFCLISGCKTVDYGGAPEQSFDIKKDLRQLEDHYKNAKSISDFYKAPTISARNEFIEGRLVLMNIRYIQFIRTLTAEKQLFDSATEMLAMSLTLTATAIEPASTKTALSAIASGVLGTHDIVNKNYYFEKTIPALISTMDAERKGVLVNILKGRNKDLFDYPITQAIIDLNTYYQAGTLQSAVMTIQVQAAENDSEATRKVQSIQRVADFSSNDLLQETLMSLTLTRLEKLADTNQIEDYQENALLNTVRELGITVDNIDDQKVKALVKAIRNSINFSKELNPSLINTITLKLKNNGISIITKEQIIAGIQAIAYDSNDQSPFINLISIEDNNKLPEIDDFENKDGFDDAKKIVVDYMKRLTGDGEDDFYYFVIAGQYLIENNILKF